jgi:hypothetical protein
MDPRWRRGPLECSRGVRPSHLENWRARRNAWMWATAPARAVAVKTDTGNGAQPRDDRIGLGERVQLALEIGRAPLHGPDLRMDAGEDSAQMHRQRRIRMVQNRRDRRQGGLRAGRQQEPVLAQNSAERVDPRDPGRYPLLAHPVCKATRACCSMRFTGTLGISPERTASRIAAASARSVLLRRMYERK